MHASPMKQAILLFLKVAIFLPLISSILLLSSCAHKKNEDYNKPAMFWYKNIYESIRSKNLELADSYYSSMQSEHINSPLLPVAIMALYSAHMEAQEYLIAEYYVDEYLKRYTNNLDSDYLGYLKIKARYYAFKNSSKDQHFMLDTVRIIKEYINEHPTTEYTYNVEYILAKFQLGLNELDLKIAKLYKREGRHFKDGVKLYMDKIDVRLNKELDPLPSHTSWWIKMFSW